MTTPRSSADLRAALEPFAKIGRKLFEANEQSDQSTLIGASAGRLNLGSLTGRDFVTAHEALSAPAEPAGEVGMIRLSASEQACYRWPEDTAEHRAMRAAYVDGAAYAAQSAPSFADRSELIAMLTDLGSVNLTKEAAERQATRMTDALISKIASLSPPSQERVDGDLSYVSQLIAENNELKSQLASRPTAGDDVVRLGALLDERDNFIVSKGLWSEFVATLPKADASPPVSEVDAEEIARTICLSYGRDPDELTSLMEMCTADNQPVPTWMVYEEQAEAVLSLLKGGRHV